MLHLKDFTYEKFQKDGLILTSTQKNNYHRDGFLVINNFIANNICDALMQRAKELISQFQPGDMKTVFSALNQQHAKTSYFMDSGDKIRFFFEENALDELGNLKKDKMLAINKIGHALHDLDPLFNCFSRSHKLATLVNDLDIQNPLLLQSMYICKQPFIGGEVTCHQDSTYLYVKQPPVGLWFALEDASLENGCMWAIPGGHKTPLKSRMRVGENKKINYEVYDEKPWALDAMIPLEVPKGSLIVLHGLLPHMSKANVSAKSRHAYTLHVISGQCEYPEDNWLQRSKQLPLRGFF